MHLHLCCIGWPYASHMGHTWVTHGSHMVHTFSPQGTTMEEFSQVAKMEHEDEEEEMIAPQSMMSAMMQTVAVAKDTMNEVWVVGVLVWWVVVV